MSLLKTTYAETPAVEDSPRVYAPAEARIRKDATPWDAEVLATCGRYSRTAMAAASSDNRSQPAEAR